MSEKIELVRETVTTERTVAYVCDCCKTEIDRTDWAESQEMLHWRMTGGYGSVFGDGAHISLDLCQECTKKLLGAYIQMKEEDWGE